jgi:hypothetical protein
MYFQLTVLIEALESFFTFRPLKRSGYFALRALSCFEFFAFSVFDERSFQFSVSSAKELREKGKRRRRKNFIMRPLQSVFSRDR